MPALSRFQGAKRSRMRPRQPTGVATGTKASSLRATPRPSEGSGGSDCSPVPLTCLVKLTKASHHRRHSLSVPSYFFVTLYFLN